MSPSTSTTVRDASRRATIQPPVRRTDNASTPASQTSVTNGRMRVGVVSAVAGVLAAATSAQRR